MQAYTDFQRLRSSTEWSPTTGWLSGVKNINQHKSIFFYNDGSILTVSWTRDSAKVTNTYGEIVLIASLAPFDRPRTKSDKTEKVS